MSIENQIAELKAAVVELTATLKAVSAAGQAAGSTATAGATTDSDKAKKNGAGNSKGGAGSKKSSVSREEMQALLLRVKESIGQKEAKKIVTEVGGVDKMAEIQEAKFDAVVAACNELLEPGDGDNGDGL